MTYELAPFGLPAGYGESILPLAEAKAHLRVEHDDEDVLIAAFRDAAVDAVEKYTGVILAPRTGDDALVWRAESLPPRVRLGVRPVTGVTAFAYIDSDGDAQTGDVATLRLGPGGEVLLKAGESWPSDINAGVQITFEGGLTAAQRAGTTLVQAVRFMTAHLYMNREHVITGTISGELPDGFRAMCAPYRAVLL